MSDFPPYLAFRDHAAQLLNVAPRELDGGARDPQTAANGANTVGGAWAYSLTVHGDPTREARGWVTADAVVITPDQNLGKLFDEAGAWTKAPNKTAKELAERLVWAFGMGYAVEYPGPIPPESDYPSPKLDVATDGTGRFAFLMSYRTPGPHGGAGGGPTDKYLVEVALTAKHEATLTRSPFP